MSLVWVLLFCLSGQLTLAMLLLVSVCLTFIWFDCCFPFHLFVFSFHCVSHSLSFPLSSCLDCIPLLIRLPFLHSLQRRRLFLPYAYYWVVLFSSVFSLFVLFVSCLFLFYRLCFFCVLSWRRCLLLGTSLPVSFCLLSLLFFL